MFWSLKPMTHVTGWPLMGLVASNHNVTLCSHILVYLLWVMNQKTAFLNMVTHFISHESSKP